MVKENQAQKKCFLEIALNVSNGPKQQRIKLW